MNDIPLGAKILKSLIAPARHSDGPTLYLICQADDGSQCTIYEQLPNGTCMSWPGPPSTGVQQAEGMIYQQARAGSSGLDGGASNFAFQVQAA